MQASHHQSGANELGFFVLLGSAPDSFPSRGSLLVGILIQCFREQTVLYQLIVGVDIIRRKPLPFFRFDSGHQFLAGHIIHLPLPSADPSVLSTTNGAGPLVGELMDIL